MAKNKVKDILNIKVDVYGEEYTIGSFFKECMVGLWEEGEGFSGKRPICDSGWEFCLYTALAKEGLIKATYDEYDDIEISDEERKKAYKLIMSALKNWKI